MYKDIKEEFCVCYTDTNCFTKCNHPVCDKCSEKIRKDCPYCGQTLDFDSFISFKEKSQ